MNKLGVYSLGIGDRFALQGEYQLKGFVEAKKLGVEITPVWNKSFREHKTVGSLPMSVRHEANQSVKALGWNSSYLVDADHITMETVQDFVGSSDFFTIDVANKIGQQLSQSQIDLFLSDHRQHLGSLTIDGMDDPFEVNTEILSEIGHKFYLAVLEAKRIYETIRQAKNGAYFAVEVSMDEVDMPQTPLELLFILLLLAEQKVPVTTIAPKFTGRFNKGVDYEGDMEAFTREFEQDLLVVRHAVTHFGLPDALKLSVHTGSDKFSLYPIINKLIKKHEAGLHLKTAGTTWLEELIGLAESGGSGLQMAKDIYAEAMKRFEELTVPYATVLNIDPARLPPTEEVTSWSGEKYANSLRHDASHPDFNPHFRQLLHTAYKVAAERDVAYLSELKKNKEIIGKNVLENILDRHIRPLFL